MCLDLRKVWFEREVLVGRHRQRCKIRGDCHFGLVALNVSLCSPFGVFLYPSFILSRNFPASAQPPGQFELMLQ